MELEILSPVHIGNGHELTVLDFVPLEDNTVVVLEVERLFQRLVEEGIDEDEILNEILNIKNHPNRYIWKRYLNEGNIKPLDFARYRLRAVGGLGPESSRIREFIKSRGRPYIPGSSVKGSIRTAVFYEVMKDRLRELDDYLYELTKSEKKVSPKRADDELEKLVFGREKNRYEPKRDPMRALVVRDTPGFGLKHLRAYRVSTVSGRQEIRQYVEGVDNLRLPVEVYIDGEVLRNGLRHGIFNGLLAGMIRGKEDFEDLIMKALNDFSKAVIKFETDKEQIGKYGSYRREVERFYRELERVEGHKLRIGWGSGWYSMTLGALFYKSVFFDDIRRKFKLGRKPGSWKLSNQFPKTRRVADNRPMAWVVLRGW